MDLRKLHRNKIEKTVFGSFGGAWSMLIHDKTTSELINTLFKKSDLLDYYITGIFSIDKKYPNWNLPIIYFVNCTKEVSKKINKEFLLENHPPIQVFSLCEPEGLDPLIKCTVTHLNMTAVEERIFTCDLENLISLANILDSKFIISYEDSTKKVAEKVQNNVNGSKLLDNKKEVSFLFLDRTLDIYTPFLYFFSFRSMMVEIGSPDCNDNYFPEVRNKHLGEVNEVLQNSVKKLQENFEKLSSKNVDIHVLDSLVIEAPKNMELKANIEKYTDYLNKAIQKLELVKEIAESQQELILGKDKAGNKITFQLDAYMPIIFSPSMTFEDRLGLLFLLKATGVILQKSEKELLISKGFAKKDLDLIFNQRNHMRRTRQRKTEFEISRYEPMLLDVVESFLLRHRVFPSFSKVKDKLDSLRRSSMMNCGKATKSTLVVYVNHGLCVEEMKLAYLISEKMGVECIFGSNKILTRSEGINEFRTNKDLQETQFANK